MRKAGDQLRISARLTRTSDGTQLWSEHYDRKLGGVFEIQEHIARAIVDHVCTKLLDPHTGPVVSRTTDDQDVYRLYLEARYSLNHQTEKGMQQAIRFLDRALKLQPGFARGHALLAVCYAYRAVYGFRPVPETVTKAEEAVRQALELDDSSALAYQALGVLSAAFRWDWPASQGAYLRALRLDPGNSTAHYSYGNHMLAPVGRLEEAEQEIRIAAELDPLSPTFSQGLCLVLYYARRYEEAVVQARHTLALETDYPIVSALLAACYSAMGRPDEAIHERQVHLRNTGRVEDAEAIGSAYATEGEPGALHWIADQLLKRADAGGETSLLPGYPLLLARRERSCSDVAGRCAECEAWRRDLDQGASSVRQPARRSHGSRSCSTEWASTIPGLRRPGPLSTRDPLRAVRCAAGVGERAFRGPFPVPGRPRLRPCCRPRRGVPGPGRCSLARRARARGRSPAGSSSCCVAFLASAREFPDRVGHPGRRHRHVAVEERLDGDVLATLVETAATRLVEVGDALQRVERHHLSPVEQHAQLVALLATAVVAREFQLRDQVLAGEPLAFVAGGLPVLEIVALVCAAATKFDASIHPKSPIQTAMKA